ncbi:helix-turn-helix domain-containing protein [Lentzea nigeriaca]|uniref:helix-turn-helix domain-containing protein n=1 Tax=Lentzea nigeriaca TaxID=1128665 RepID=UPI00195792AA|nr:XRE family transcriptional regulator [Lentzea nigeriaca]MBM7861892.1 tetratricopeptide (TPR) repeat protein [Lentzea nigeriaca]
MTTERPDWARRIRAERDARGWSQAEAVRALRAHSKDELPTDSSLLRRWKAWEAGDNAPDDFYKQLIAKTFGTVTHAFFPKPGRRDGGAEILAVTGMDTLDILSRLQRSDVDTATLDALRITVDRLCSEYAYMPSEQLIQEGRTWLRRVAELQGGRLTLSQHREVLTLAGMLALLVGCVEYDMGDRRAAEATRRAALNLGTEADNADVMGWAYEMRAWFGLTAGDLKGVIAAGEIGTQVARNHSVAVQLAAQEAKAWARIGDRRQTELALERGRQLLESLPYPENLDNHFVVDPSKYDFYVMDCYRKLGEQRMAETLANEVIRASTDFDGTERAPMRIAEARITLGVVAARNGDLEGAIEQGKIALGGERKSLPSLRMVSQDLGAILAANFTNEMAAQEYLEILRRM